MSARDARRAVAIAIAVGLGSATAPGALAAPNHGASPPGDRRAAPAPATMSAAAPARGRIYAGTTSERDPIVVGLARTGRRVTRITLQIAAECAREQGAALFVDQSAALTVRRSGRFAGARPVEVQLAGGRTLRGQLIVKGTVAGRRIKGSVVADGDLVDAAGTTVDQCAQRFTYTARSGRGRFGGVTSQGAPIAFDVRDGATIDDDGIRLTRTVRAITLGWRAPWSDGGGVAQVGEQITNFPIDDARFGDTWTYDFTDDDGSSNAVDYDLEGALDGKSIDGSFRILWTRTDPAGVRSTADTGPVTFRARSG